MGIKQFTNIQKKHWWVKMVGFVPSEEEIAMLVDLNPGLAIMVSEVFNLSAMYNRWKREDKMSKEEGNNE